MIRLPSRELPQDTTNAILSRKCDWIVGICTEVDAMPRNVIAFGSAVSAVLREDSDIDLALIFSDETVLRRAKAAVSATPREDLWPLDILYYTKEDFEVRAKRGGVCSIIRDEGRVLYSCEEEE